MATGQRCQSPNDGRAPAATGRGSDAFETASAPRRILVTGASGLVGGAVARLAARAGHQVTGTVNSYPHSISGLVHQLRLDLQEEAPLEAAVLAASPQAIINCAAVSEPGACERDPGRARRLNVDLPATLARLAQRHGIRLVHISTEQVFAGENAPYRPTDGTSPLNTYGRLKAESEAVVQSLAPAAATVRAPLLLGNSPGGKRSLHERLLADWAAGRTARLFVDEIRQVAHADNLAAVLLELALRWDLTGIFHWAGTEACTRHELGTRIRQHFGLNEPEAPIEAVTRAQVGDAARTRPRDLRLDLAPLSSNLHVRPQALAEQLAALLPPHARRI